ncbi:hypothetical protein VT50_0208700 [Streptomyces antioxidans]|uniref:FHA domain-containing protein n=1 Tax=Streptomyces antioxidans TaxID=1507734 RepID=A0A1V4D919_9ACTN|nr:FHA domain-containing protein [Streptomyces antioxidans]OPF81738.1 hypothetical protein VT50_0208700 [Streptomyces antioxidans]
MPELVLHANGRTWTLDASRSYTIGRDQQADIPCVDRRVSRRHLVIRCDGGTWAIEDLGSANGTFADGCRIQRMEIGHGSIIRLGDVSTVTRLDFTGAPAVVNGDQAPRPEGPATAEGPAAALSIDRDPSGVHRLVLGQRLRIGRAQDNELVVEGPYVSRHHAEFRPLPGGRFEIVDLGSHNGTYVNGRPVDRRIIGPHDIVGVGHSTFRLAGDRLEEFVDTGEVYFSARGLTVTVGRGRTILDDVSFGVPEKSLVAVIGPSGSGKSTLLRALTGYRPADRGQVFYDHRDLYAQFAERATGLSRSAYLMSKVIVLGLITAMQGVVICAIGFSVRRLPARGLLMPTAVEVCVVIGALGFTAMMFGLVISALVRTPEKTMPLLVMFAVVQVVFTGVLFKLFDAPGIEQIGWLMPARWAVAGSGTTLDLGHTMPPWDLERPDDIDPLWAHTVAQWGIDLGVLLAIGLVCGFAVARLLRRHEPEVMRD